MKTKKVGASESKKEDLKRRDFLKAGVAGAAALAAAVCRSMRFGQQKSKVYKFRLQSLYAPTETSVYSTL